MHIRVRYQLEGIPYLESWTPSLSEGIITTEDLKNKIAVLYGLSEWQRTYALFITDWQRVG